MERLKIKDTPGWVKDLSSKAVLNSDLSALEQRKLNKKKNIQINNITEDLSNVKSELETLRTDIKDIKDILLQFVKSSGDA
jgi:uncharacterized protein (DUF342 family)